MRAAVPVFLLACLLAAPCATAETKKSDPFASLWTHPEAAAAAKDFARGRYKKAAERADACMRGEPLGAEEKIALGYLRGVSRLKLGLEPDPSDFMRAMNAVRPPGLGDHAAWHLGQHLWRQGKSTSELKAFELAEPYFKRMSLAGRHGLDAHLMLVRGAAAAGRPRWAVGWAEKLAEKRFRRAGESRALLALAQAEERLAWSLLRDLRKLGKAEDKAAERGKLWVEAKAMLAQAGAVYRRVAGLWPDQWAGSVAAENLKRLRQAKHAPAPDQAWLLRRARALVEHPYGRKDRTTMWRLRALLPGDPKDASGAEADLLLAEQWIRYRRFRDAFRRLTRVKQHAPSADLKARAGLLLARLTARRRSRAAVAEYLKVAKRWPTSSSAAAALFRAGELARRLKQPDRAAKLFERCVREYPEASSSAGCRWGLAWMAIRAGEDERAEKILGPLCTLGQWLDDEDLVIQEVEDEAEAEGAEGDDSPSPAEQARDGDSDELARFDLDSRRLRERALYWRGRLLERQQRVKAAVADFRTLMNERPFSYYALLAWERLAALGRDEGLLAQARGAAAAPAPDPKALHPEVGAAYSYYRMGLHQLAQTSLRSLRLLDLEHPVDRRLAAQLWERYGDHRRSHRLAPVPRSGGLPDFPEAGWQTDARLAYPRAFAEQVESEMRDPRVSPAMIYALMRVESGFWVKAHSPAGARGLTQVITRTAYAVARKLKLKGFRQWKLYQPEVAVQVGTAYLGDLLDLFGHPALAFAAYNAGETAVGRWLRQRGELPLDAFIEEIPYSETARYTRRTLAYLAVYRALYRADALRPLEQGFTEPARKAAQGAKSNPPSRGRKTAKTPGNKRKNKK